jgi:hypothetical protein
MSGNEASAIGSLRAINSAQSTFSSSCGGNGYANTLVALATPPTNGGTAGFISPDLGVDPAIKSGYTVTMTGVGATPITLAAATCNAVANSMPSYFANATPVTAGSTGQRAFATDVRGTIYFKNDGTSAIPAAMTGASPLQ